MKEWPTGNSRDNGSSSRRGIITGEASDPDRLAKTPLPESGVYRFCSIWLRSSGVSRFGTAGGVSSSPRKCYLPPSPGRCSIKFAEKVAEASPRKRVERARRWTRKFALEFDSQLRSGEISPLVRHHERKESGGAGQNAVRLMQL